MKPRFTKLDSTLAQDIVGGGVRKAEVWQAEMRQQGLPLEFARAAGEI
jgi:hypothetical protein